MKTSAHSVIGGWRVVAADVWERGYLGLIGPAVLLIGPNGDGEVNFGLMQASLFVDYGPDEIGFTWTGSDEMNEVSGAGSTELQNDGTLQITFEDESVDEAVFKAVREPTKASG